MEKTKTTTTCGGDHGDDHDLPLLLPEVYFMIQEILVCLPVKSLLRFKSVCKSWRQLIQTPFFINLHTTHNSSSSSSKFGDTNFILQTREPFSKEYKHDIKLYMFSSSESRYGDQIQKKKKMVFKLDEDVGFSAIYKEFQLTDTLRMVGSCNGIICLHGPKLLDSISKGVHNLRDVYLWNPATRQFRILPKSIPIEEKQKYKDNFVQDFIGFGFDIKTKDYKVLRITLIWDDVCMCRVQVYSLSTDSWRVLEGINSLPCLPNQDQFLNSGIYLNGSYFFLGIKLLPRISDEMMMLSFDFTKEIFTTMQLPFDNSFVLSYLGEKLAVFTSVPLLQIDDPDDGYWYIWVLNEQQQGLVNKESSWTKLHSFPIKSSRVPRIPWAPDDYNEPRCISNNGEFALISTGTMDDGFSRNNKLQLFNLITKEAIKDFTIGTTRKCRAEVYKESLVSIMDGGNVLLRWQLPTHGTTYKLYLDAPFINSYRPFGIGLCLISDTGGCIGVRSLKRYVSDAEEGEAQAMLEAIKWAKKLELSPIIIESDFKKCVSFFMEDDDDNNSTYWSSAALSLLREAKLLLNSSEIGSISLKYCSRSCNYVADIASKLGREGLTWSCKEWTANSPGDIVSSLSNDLGLITDREV